jgi:hypothetical protein
MRKYGRKRPLGKPGHRREDNIKMCVKERNVMGRHGMD